MFDIGFSELMLIAVVALIVIGPERLPKVARTLGHLFGRMQRYVNDVKADISREMELDELKKLQSSMQDAARSFEQSVTSSVNSAETELQKIAQEANPTALPPPVPDHVALADEVASAAAPAEPTPQLELALPPLPEAHADKRA
jgi:sec-independent protein translocase protein TatB